jgi:transcriptional regulator with XRE-family HTH domain
MGRITVTYGPPVTPAIERGLEALGTGVRRSRRRLGLSQSALAARSGVSQSVISRLERGVLLGLRLRRLAELIDSLDGVEIPPTDRFVMVIPPDLGDDMNDE